MMTLDEQTAEPRKKPSIKQWVTASMGPFVLAALASSMCTAFFMKAHWETASLNTPFIEGPLFPLLLFTLLLILLLTIAFASLKTHAYWLRTQERVTVEKSSFVRMASDTLRTPLTGLRWTTELMLSGQFGNITAEQKESMTNMDEAIQRVIGLVNELLEVMRLSGGIINYNPEPTDVAALVRGSVRDMQSVAGTKRVKIGFGQISHDVLIMMDSPLIRHVLSTLVSGAIHLSDINNIIVLHAEPTDDQIAIGVTYKGEKIAFKNFDSNEKAIQKAALPINLGDLDLTISWEILNAANGSFWTVSKGMDHTLFIGIPLVAAPDGVKPTNTQFLLDDMATTVEDGVEVPVDDAEAMQFISDDADASSTENR